jgi:hypothetical protein
MDHDINEDYKTQLEADSKYLQENIEDILKEKRVGMLWTVRMALQNSETYDDAVNYFKTEPLAAPVYYIVSGTEQNEGCVITRDRDSVYNVATLDVANGEWYLVQSNYDRDLPDPKLDPRRTVAQERLDAIGRNDITKSNLYSEVLALYPNNNNQTTQIVVMQASTGFYKITQWI